MRTRNKIIGVCLLALLSVVILLSFERKVEIPVIAEYPEKKVYTTDLSLEEQPFIDDCKNLGGEFNTCGSPCAPEDQFCTAVCAYTCEL